MSDLTTESRNKATMHLDEMSITEILKTMNDEDQKVPQQIRKVIPDVTKVIEITTKQFRAGGGVIYIGAGASGRLGVLDAAEGVPTFNTSPDEVIGVSAGGQGAITVAVEGVEDR